ncbi:2TM domain-containing protein [Maribacter sp. 2210JD10-5]|uniref:2TM domain-containing protein n=1 Tax=Maribacter sp. 2210JD10-5 TaxID=3386272 RepID=UPI0039BD13A5
MENSNEHKYRRAKERVVAMKCFYNNLIAYCIVIPFLAWVNYNTSNFPWVIFPAVGWGIGVFAHWANAYGYHPILGKDWEERKIKELMNNNEF